MSLPLGRITPVVTRVAFPIFSRLQEQLDEMKNGYIRLVYWLCAIQWPLFVGLGIVAEDFVLVLFGEKWLTAVPILQVLCWVGAIRSIGVGGGVLLTAKGETKVLFLWNVFWTACLTLILVPFAYRGGEWLAWGQLVATLTGGLGWHWVIAKHGKIDYIQLLRQLSIPIYSILAMLVCLFLFRMFVVESPVIRLLGAIIVGGLAYIVTLIALTNTSNIPYKRS
jgi:lipopolysaccharide exporter